MTRIAFALVLTSLLVGTSGRVGAQTAMIVEDSDQVSRPRTSYYEPRASYYEPRASYYESQRVVRYATPSTTTYYPRRVSYYESPVVTYYEQPYVTYSPVVTYAPPVATYSPAPVTVTRYGLLGRPRRTVTYYP